MREASPCLRHYHPPEVAYVQWAESQERRFSPVLHRSLSVVVCSLSGRNEKAKSGRQGDWQVLMEHPHRPPSCLSKFPVAVQEAAAVVSSTAAAAAAAAAAVGSVSAPPSFVDDIPLVQFEFSEQKRDQRKSAERNLPSSPAPVSAPSGPCARRNYHHAIE